MPHLYVIRHCEPTSTGALLGQCDPPLSDSGRDHAATLLVGIRLIAVYSSPLRRALETAQAIARGVPVTIVDDFREITYGDWDGLTWAEIESAEPNLAARKLLDWTGVTPPGGETYSSFTARVTRAFDRISNGPRPAAIVAHAAVNQILCGFDQPYGGVHEL
jgi:broad specificity phosphatase PhoE